MKWNKALPLLFILLSGLIVFFFLPIHKAFTFTEQRTEKPQTFYVRAEKETEFQIRYVHSIFLTDVTETYRLLPDDTVQFLSMEYEDIGIGLPGYAEEGQSIKVEDGKYKLFFDDKVIDSFILYVGDVDAGLTFIYQGQEIDLKEHLTRGKSYLFSAKRKSMYQLMKGVDMNG